jgi:hypothetical protein
MPKSAWAKTASGRCCCRSRRARPPQPELGFEKWRLRYLIADPEHALIIGAQLLGDSRQLAAVALDAELPTFAMGGYGTCGMADRIWKTRG